MYKFKDGDKVCFFGDSITHAGFWIRRIYDYYRNVLGIKLEMYNCGVSGNHAFHAKARMEKSLLCFDPTVVVIDFGMNDCGRWIYDGGPFDEDWVKEHRECLDNCISNLKFIADTLTEKGIKVIFCTPTPYDELTESEEQCLFGTQGALIELSGRIKALAVNYGGYIIDFNSQMFETLKKLYKEDKTIINEDRVHPSPAGHELMAQIFLKEQGFDVKPTETLEELEEIANSPYDEWEIGRFDLEQKSKASEWVDLCMFYDLTEEEILKKLPDFIKEEKNEYVLNCCKAYLEERHNIPALKAELIKYTKIGKCKN